jgi:putative hemolysin
MASGYPPPHDLENIIGPVQHDESVATASGWVTQRLGGFPKTGDVFVAGDYELRVEAMDGLRVAQLKITQLKFPEGTTTMLSREPPRP